MRRPSALLACLLLATAVRAASPLDRLRLIDWVNPGEPAYEALRQAAAQQHAEGWAAERLQKGEALPQASARELALELEEDPSLGSVTAASLKQSFHDEPSDLGLSEASSGLQALEAKMAALNARMDALEAANRANLYDSRSRPAVRVAYSGAWIESGGGGLIQGETQGYFQGGLNVTFSGSDPVFSVGISQYTGRQQDGSESPPTAIGSLLYDYGLGLTIGGKDGSWDVHLGGSDSIKTSALVSGLEQGLNIGKDFYLDLEAGSQPTYGVADQTLDLPYGSWLAENAVTAHRRTTGPWWPFSDSVLYYAVGRDLLQSFSDKFAAYGAGLRLDTGGGLPFIQANAFRAAVSASGNDEDRMRAGGVNLVRRQDLGAALGWESDFRDGSILQAEFAQAASTSNDPNYAFTDTSNLSGYSGGAVRGLERDYLDRAWVASLSRPFGPISLGLEASQIGPYFVAREGAFRSWMVNGVAAMQSANPGNLTPWALPPAPGGNVSGGHAQSLNDSTDLRWGSDLGNPVALRSNAQKLGLKAQGSFGWLSGFFTAGTALQLQPSAYWVRTQPYFEAGDNGRLLYERFGSTFYQPPNPFAAAPSPLLGSTSFPISTNPAYFQWRFNRPTDGYAVYDAAGNSIPVHWQALSQESYHSVNLTLLLTRAGLGDPRLLDDSIKATNYANAKLVFDLQSALRLSYPAQLTVGGELRDLSPQAGLPRLDPGRPSEDPGASFLDQAILTGMLRLGLNPWLQVLISGGYEHWRSDHGFLPFDVEVRSAGVGADLDLASILSGLGLFWRSRILYLSDLTLDERETSLWENSVGSSLSF